MNELELTVYRELLAGIKNRVRTAQQKAALSANAAMLLMYWEVGRMIADRQAKQGWGAKVIPRLSVDLKNELPEEKGFSPANLKRMVKFWGEYPELSRMGAPPVRQITSDVTSQVDSADYELTRALPEKLASSLPSIEAIEAELSRHLGSEIVDG